MRVQDLIKQKPYLLWFTKNYKELSDASVVEAVLNYGDWSDVQKVIKILGVKKTALIFKNQINKKRVNYNDITKNYFTLYFEKHAK